MSKLNIPDIPEQPDVDLPLGESTSKKKKKAAEEEKTRLVLYLPISYRNDLHSLSMIEGKSIQKVLMPEIEKFIKKNREKIDRFDEAREGLR